jgi:hypothetical protein
MSSQRTSPPPNQANGNRRLAPNPLGGRELNGNGEAEEGQTGGQRRRGARPNQLDGNVPPVRDATGEKVLEGFQTFLKRFIIIFTLVFLTPKPSLLVLQKAYSSLPLLVQKMI